MAPLSELLTQALADTELLRQNQVALIDQVNDFFTQRWTATLTESDGVYSALLEHLPLVPGNLQLSFYVGGALITIGDTDVDLDGVGAFENSTYIQASLVSYAGGTVQVEFKDAITPDVGMAVVIDYPAKVPFTKPDGSQVMIPSLFKFQLDALAFMSNAQAQFAPCSADTPRTFQNPTIMQTLYVNANAGSDFNSGFSADDPFQTVAHAFSLCRSNQFSSVILAHGTSGQQQVYTVNDGLSAGVANKSSLILANDDTSEDSRDNTIVDFSGFSRAFDGGCIRIDGTLGIYDLTLKGGQRLDPAVPEQILGLPILLCYGVAELIHLVLKPSDEINDFVNPPTPLAQCAIEVRGGGSVAIFGDSVISMNKSLIKINGISLRGGGWVNMVDTAIQSCYVGVTDQALGRPGGTVTGEAISWGSGGTDNGADFDFGTPGAGQVANHNLES